MEPWFSAAAAAAAAGCCLVVLFFFCAFFAFWSKMVKIHVANWHAAGASEAGLNTKKKLVLSWLILAARLILQPHTPLDLLRILYQE